jgi:2-C-methyl-D-erythritol 4-phosphate cytidylyltransferase/2-C-methyl-D-erythritol 4-phosphate cytidylyltransferase/2-C-methyl-D-erythritol 2,4-cyclodiphosphate synthase
VDASFAAVIAASGSSSRMGLSGRAGPSKKEYLPLGPAYVDRAGKPLTVLGAAVSAFADIGEVAVIVVAVPPGGEAEARAALPVYLSPPPVGNSPPGPKLLFASGGSSRRISVHRALSLLESYGPSWVLIHDGARPWVSGALIRRVMAGTRTYAAAVPLLPLAETPKEIDGQGFIRRHLRRSGLGSAQTPQGFAFPGILRAHERGAERESAESYEYTDDAELWGEFCGPVAVVPGERENRKITYPEDLCLRESRR